MDLEVGEGGGGIGCGGRHGGGRTALLGVGFSGIFRGLPVRVGGLGVGGFGSFGSFGGRGDGDGGGEEGAEPPTETGL